MFGIPEGRGVSGEVERSLASSWASPTWSTELPGRLIDAFKGALPADGAALLFVADASRLSLHAVCATPGLALRVEDAQQMTGEGPATEAFRTRRPVLVPHIGRVGKRWPALVDALPHDHRSSVYAFSLEIGSVRVGVLDLYRARACELSRRDLAAAVRASLIVAGGLLEVLESSTAESSGPWSDGAGRHVLMQQAIDVVAGQLDTDRDEASLRLRAHAYASGRSLSVVVADVREGRLRLEP